MLSGTSNGSFQYDYGASLGGPSGRRNSAIKYWVLSGSKLSVPFPFLSDKQLFSYANMKVNLLLQTRKGRN